MICSLLQRVGEECWSEYFFPIFPVSAPKPLNGKFHSKNYEGSVVWLCSGQSHNHA